MRIFVLGLMAMLCVSSFNAMADDAPRTISTHGEATLYVTPDQVIVHFGIETYEPTIGKAAQNSRDYSAALSKAIKELGIDDNDVAAGNMEVTILYQHPQVEEPSTIKGYLTRKTFVVKLMNIAQLDRLVETGLKQGANQLLAVEFQSTEMRKYRDQARQQAIKSAKEKAEAITSELGCKVGKVRTINEGGGSVTFGRGTWSNRPEKLGNLAPREIQPVPTFSEITAPLPLGKIAVQASVFVGFDLAD